MSYQVHTRGRRIAAPVALAGALAASAFALTPAAFASHHSSVSSNVHRADLALRTVTSAAAPGNVSVPLSALLGDLGAATKLSTNLAVHASTPHAEQLAASALTLLAREQTKAEVKLTATLATATGVEQAAIAHAASTVAEGRELALSALARLATQARAEAHAGAHAIATELATVSTAGQGVLAKLLTELQPGTANCPSDTPLAQLASTETAAAQADVTRVEGIVSLLGDGLSADVSQLALVTAKQADQIDVQLKAAANCPATDDAAAETTLTGTNLTLASATAQAAGTIHL
jgi:hypothetical protein